MTLRTICAWCESDGIETVLQHGAEPTSHGICARHAAGVLASAGIEDAAFPGQPIEVA